METCAHYPYVNSSPRAAAMVLALISAIVLSPLYIDRKSDSRLESRWSSGGLVLPAVVAGLIVAIKTTTSSSSVHKRADDFQYQKKNEASFAFRIGSSSWGLAGILIMLLFVISCQSSLQQLFWK